MGTINNFRKNLRGYKHMVKWLNKQATMSNKFGYKAPNAVYEEPCNIDSPSGVYLYENTKLRSNCTIINSPERKLIVKKYSAIASGCTFITNGHTSTVGIPHFLLGPSHINDKSGDIIIGEDVWMGANCTVMPGITIGRGAIIGTGSLVTKDVPPYALVVGSPAKVVGKKFELEDVIKHEKELYPENERMTYDELKSLFDSYFEGKKTFGTNRALTVEDKVKLQHVKIAYRFVPPF